jgi:hypothetical protein
MKLEPGLDRARYVSDALPSLPSLVPGASSGLYTLEHPRPGLPPRGHYQSTVVFVDGVARHRSPCGFMTLPLMKVDSVSARGLGGSGDLQRGGFDEHSLTRRGLCSVVDVDGDGGAVAGLTASVRGQAL